MRTDCNWRQPVYQLTEVVLCVNQSLKLDFYHTYHYVVQMWKTESDLNQIVRFYFLIGVLNKLME